MLQGSDSHFQSRGAGQGEWEEIVNVVCATRKSRRPVRGGGVNGVGVGVGVGGKRIVASGSLNYAGSEGTLLRSSGSV